MHRLRVWQPPGAPLCSAAQGREVRHRMNRSMPQLLGFIVLAAILLATGFGAMG